MGKREFIKQNKELIDEALKNSGYKGRINNEEREEFLINDEGLYNLAKQEGVKL